MKNLQPPVSSVQLRHKVRNNSIQPSYFALDRMLAHGSCLINCIKIGLAGYVDNYKKSNSLLETLNMTRYKMLSFRMG